MEKIKKLTEEDLARTTEEVFDILSKLGQGSYGSVFKAKHKVRNDVFAIKQIPLGAGTDLQEIINEISIMEQCDSPYVVKYYGSYFKNTEIWIVMEYCGVGSVLDIMKLRGLHWRLPKGQAKVLNEQEIAIILLGTLKGLEYLHLRKKIHRDIKAGNILLTENGHAKLGDFGVAGQLTDTLAKRYTGIGTPYWMAPEISQEIGKVGCFLNQILNWPLGGEISLIFNDFEIQIFQSSASKTSCKFLEKISRRYIKRYTYCKQISEFHEFFSKMAKEYVNLKRFPPKIFNFTKILLKILRIVNYVELLISNFYYRL